MNPRAMLLVGLMCLRALEGFAATPCQKVSEVCVDGPSTKVINGISVTRSCWKYEAKYQCVADNYVDFCQSLRDRGCSQIGTTCTETDPQMGCTTYDNTYQCPAGTTQPQTVTNCGGQTYCADGNCFDTGTAPDQDFAKAVTATETAREWGKYFDPTTMTVFNGLNSQCSDKLSLGNMGDCCSKGEVGPDGSSVLSDYAMQAAMNAATSALLSTYTFDILMASGAPSWMLAGLETLAGATGGGSSALAAYMAGDISFSSFASSLVPGPWTVAVMAVVYLYMEWVKCEEEEILVGMKNKLGLCHYVGSYCSRKVLGTCLENKQNFCCYNSKLARIINEQGRPQLGKGWGTPRAPDCSGFTPAQLEALDFSKMDLSEFYAEIKAQMPDNAALQAKVGQTTQNLQQQAQQKYQNYFQ